MGRNFHANRGSEVLPRDVHSVPRAPLSGKAAHLVRGGAGERRRRMQHRGDTDLWRGPYHQDAKGELGVAKCLLHILIPESPGPLYRGRAVNQSS